LVYFIWVARKFTFCRATPGQRSSALQAPNYSACFAPSQNQIASLRSQ
jgi:hypothetical protein